MGNPKRFSTAFWEREAVHGRHIVSSTPASRAQAAWGAMKRAFGADSDTAQHQLEKLKQLADQKGRAETRVRYRFVEDEKTGEVKVVGYHTSEGSGMDMVKIRHVKQTAPGTYEFREDGADSPILVWYTNASSMYKALSQQALPQYFNQRGGTGLWLTRSKIRMKWRGTKRKRRYRMCQRFMFI